MVRCSLKIIGLVGLAAWLLTAAARAQHGDVLVWNNAGSVGVGVFDFDSGASSEQRVHVGRFDDFYSVNNPGFAAFAGPDALPGNADLGWDFLPMTVDSGPHAGFASTLLYWDGLGEEPTFGPTPTPEYQFSIFGRNGPGVADGGAEITAGDVIDRTPPNGAIHEHRFYFLDDNGDGLNITLPEAGIYLIGLRLRIGDLEPSDPLFMVWATPETSVLPAIQPAAAWARDRVDTLFVEGLPGDFNADGSVNGTDLLSWQRGESPSPGSAADLAIWERHFGTLFPAGSSVAGIPEPPALAIALVATAAIFLRRWLDSSSGAVSSLEDRSSPRCDP